MEVLVLSDTHVPGEATSIPAVFRERIAAADHVIHAGDFDSIATYEDVSTLADNLTAVYGNRDPNDIDLPPVASLTVEDVTFVVTHGRVNHVERAVTSSDGVVKASQEDRWFDAIADAARARNRGSDGVVAVGGHTHQVVDETHEDIRVLNPGTATGAGDTLATLMTVHVEDGDVDVTVHEA